MIDLWESLFRTVSALAIVLVLMGIVAVIFRRLMGRRLGAVGGVHSFKYWRRDTSPHGRP